MNACCRMNIIKNPCNHDNQCINVLTKNRLCLITLVRRYSKEILTRAVTMITTDSKHMFPEKIRLKNTKNKNIYMFRLRYLF